MITTKCPFLNFMEPIKARLIDNWKLFFKFWSVKIDLISLAISGYATVFPQVANDAWNQFPQQFKDMLPQTYLPYISMGLLVLSLIARSIKQNNLMKANNEPEHRSGDQPHDHP